MDLDLLRRDVEKRSLPGTTHWHGCYLDPGHRDCAILMLLDEVERLRAELASRGVPYDTASSGAPNDTRSGTNGPETGETAPDRGGRQDEQR